jgi:hypothetical protein
MCLFQILKPVFGDEADQRILFSMVLIYLNRAKFRMLRIDSNILPLLRQLALADLPRA